MKAVIREIRGRQVLDSRGNPTVEAEVVLENGIVGRGICPSGASTGAYEAIELRDSNSSKYGGKGVAHAVANINTVISGELVGKNVLEQQNIDNLMIQLDGTPDKSNLGANSILAVSMAAARAGAAYMHLPLYRYIGGISGCRLPIPMMNVINGGAHANNNLDVQEFMIVPVGAESFREALRWCSEVYHALRTMLKDRRQSIALGDEGGFAPDLQDDEAAMDLILEAIQGAGYKVPDQFMLALDVASSEWAEGDAYRMPKRNLHYTGSELVKHWINLCARYPICSLEDPLGENDWNNWRKLTADMAHLGNCMLVGDDLFVTNAHRLQQGVETKCANSILVKLNQIGTLSETLNTVRLAKGNGYKVIISHRSGDTEDSFIADLAVGINAPFIKSGAPARSERVAKYNQLCRIEENSYVIY